MKKVFVLTIVVLIAVSGKAQIVSSRSSMITREYKPTKNQFWFDCGIGIYTGDITDYYKDRYYNDDEGMGMALDLGFRWTKMYTDNIGWDVLKLSAQSDLKHIGKMVDVQLKSGVRGVSPVLFGNSTIYGNVALGYGYYIYHEKGDFVWEVGAGINITPKLSIGVSYNNHSLEEYSSKYYSDKETLSCGILSLRAGVCF